MEFFLKEMGRTEGFLSTVTLHTHHVLFSTQEHYCRAADSCNFIKKATDIRRWGFIYCTYFLPLIFFIL